MPVPLLDYPSLSQNQRVAGYEVPGDEQPWIYTTDNGLDGSEMDELIRAAYRQIFNEQQSIVRNRQVGLESQLRSGQITVRDFIRGLVLSDNFRYYNYEPNNNYRFAEMCVQRLLGRSVYNDREKIAWSIVLATKGLYGFVDDLLDSEEYLSNFGENTVPYQRRRILPQRGLGEVSFAHFPRYGEDYRQKLEAMGYFQDRPTYRWAWQQPPYPVWVRRTGTAIAVGGSIFVGALAIASALAAWGIISL